MTPRTQDAERRSAVATTIAIAAALLALGWSGHSIASSVRGNLVLGAYRPEADPETPSAPSYWELENGFKEVVRDRVDAARELAVVLVGEGAAGAAQVDVPFRGGSLMPTTIVVRTGTTLRLRNEDEVAHELYAVDLDGFSREATSPRGVRSVNLRSAGHWVLRDNLVIHVLGHLHVIDNLVAIGKVESDGRYLFGDVAPGAYTLKVFHGENEIASQAIEVADKKDLAIDPITLTAAAAK